MIHDTCPDLKTLLVANPYIATKPCPKRRCKHFKTNYPIEQVQYNIRLYYTQIERNTYIENVSGKLPCILHTYQSKFEINYSIEQAQMPNIVITHTHRGEHLKRQKVRIFVKILKKKLTKEEKLCKPIQLFLI